MLLCRSKSLASSTSSSLEVALLLPFRYWDGIDNAHPLQELRLERQRPKMLGNRPPSRAPLQTTRTDMYGSFDAAVRVHPPRSTRSGAGVLRRAAGAATLLFFAVAGYSGVFQNVNVSDALQGDVVDAVNMGARSSLQGVEKAFVEGVDVENIRKFQHKFSRFVLYS
jgi:hypothetical protein